MLRLHSKEAKLQIGINKHHLCSIDELINFSLVWLYYEFIRNFSLHFFYSPVLSELQSRVSFSARSPGLGPCFIQVAMVKWSVRFWGTTQSGILAAWWPSNLKINSLSRPLSVTKDAVQLVTALGAGRRSVLPDEAPGGHQCGEEWKVRQEICQ